MPCSESLSHNSKRTRDYTQRYTAKRYYTRKTKDQSHKIHKIQSHKIHKIQSHKMHKIQSHKIHKIQSHKIHKIQSHKMHKIQSHKINNILSHKIHNIHSKTNETRSLGFHAQLNQVTQDSFKHKGDTINRIPCSNKSSQNSKTQKHTITMIGKCTKNKLKLR